MPRISVDPPAPFDPSKPSPITFTVSNINIVPLHNVKIGLGICYIRSADHPPLGSDIESDPKRCNDPPIAGLIRWQVDWLDTDEKYELNLEDLLNIKPSDHIERADITIFIMYEPWRLPKQRTRQFRFLARPLSDGKIYWEPMPLNL